MDIKNKVLHAFFACIMGSTVAMERGVERMHTTAASVSYQEFINNDSLFSLQFQALPVEEQLLRLFKCGTTESVVPAWVTGRWLFSRCTSRGEFHRRLRKMGAPVKDDYISILTITDVPGLVPEEVTSVRLCMKLIENYCKFVVVDAHDNTCLKGNAENSTGSLYLKSLRITPQGGDSGFNFEGRKRLISGTTAMKLWDRIGVYGGFKDTDLCDMATCNGFTLRILLPYICGRTWYAKFGYIPKYTARDDYSAHVRYLARRSCKEILHDFEDNPTAHTMLRMCLSICNLKEDSRLGILAHTLYYAMRAQKVGFQSLLKYIYIHFLRDYCCSDQFKECEIRSFQKTLETSSFIKHYC